MMACEAAVFLRGRGKDVLLVSPHGLDQLATGMESRLRRWFLLNLWPKVGIPFYAYHKVEGVTEKGLIVRDKKYGGRVRLLEGDTVVFGLGLRSENKLLAALGEPLAAGIYRIGDCIRPRSILEAVHEGYQAGVAI